MTRTSSVEGLKTAVAQYLAALRPAADDDRVAMMRLASALDTLIAVYNGLPETEPDADVESPSFDGALLYRQVAQAFPLLGVYPDLDPLEGVDQERMCGDAIDDLADIARDLMAVQWFIEHEHAGTAIWDFRFGYQTHWGDHLHDVRRYLHRMLYWR